MWYLSTDKFPGEFPAHTVNSNDAALKLCNLEAVGPAGVMQVASYLTETSTSHVDSAPSAEPRQSESSSVTTSINTPIAAPASQPTQSIPASTESSSKSTAAVAPAPLVIASSTYSASVVTSAGGTSTVYNVGGQTLGVGSSIVIGSGISTTTILLQTNTNGNTQVVVNGKTSNLPAASTAPSIAPVVIASLTITPSVGLGGNTVLDVGGQTLAAGSTITLGSGKSATTIAYQVSNGVTQIVVNGQTSAFSTAVTSNGQSVGALILSGIGGVPTDANSSSIAMATVNGGRREKAGIGLIVHMALVALVMGFSIFA